MWFKNLRIYQVSNDAAFLDSGALAQHEFQPCGSLDPLRYGFIPPVSVAFTHDTLGAMSTMVCAKKQEKILPSAAINESLNAKVEDLQKSESRTVGRKERSTLKDEIIFSLLPKALTKSTLTYGYYDTELKMFVVNSSGARGAEDLLSKTREALGSLKAIPLTPKTPITLLLTEWVKTGKLPEHFALGGDVELRNGKDNRIVRCKNHDLAASEVLNHIESGLYVSKVSLEYRESIYFSLDADFAIKGLKFSDAILDKSNENNPETKAEQFDSDFNIMSLEVRELIGALLAAFGGLRGDS